MPGAPPKGFDGEPATLNGVPLVAGNWNTESAFSPRATTEELWADLEIGATPDGRAALWAGDAAGGAYTDDAGRRFSAYVSQAHTFYSSAVAMDARSRPLAAYYCVLNLAKAWLTLRNPPLTAPKMLHGSADAFELKPRQYYTFSKEKITLHTGGVAPEVARHSGNGAAPAKKTEIALADLLPHLCEAGPARSGDSLLPLRSLSVQRGSVVDAGTKKGMLFLRAEVDRGVLSGARINPSSLPTRIRPFGTVFKHVQGSDSCVRYESDAVVYGQNTSHALPEIRRKYEQALIYVDRRIERGRFFLAEPPHDLSQEAVTFLVLHHLSNMVRYRPEQVERLADGGRSWLLSSWVSRALENSLLTYGTRILGRELRIG